MVIGAAEAAEFCGGAFLELLHSRLHKSILT